ncbi:MULTISPECIES: hypothetical protein [Pediococcus]|uniref:hypothetical protein n=1 Tax=Pediococcus TaxID=1253 RepID=UPI000E8003D0|nr:MULTISPECIES: hypothetical protein [Pediococcus]MCT3029514.1 hypothetical protein [Pediococcus parvulus]MCT3030121.1 hypothetical protein [Pediococcus parvulus]MCT3035101.1 hypothetical protein [Pediococcus parvulus]MDN5575762.1 hypothetical protein [Pediococcus sp.]HBO47324.1 hypothetical protein [Pediococcus sp.]
MTWLTIYIIVMGLVALYVCFNLVRAIKRDGFFNLIVLIWFLVLIVVVIATLGVVSIMTVTMQP